MPSGPDAVADLTGRTAVVTGANSGLGKEVARALAGLGARVVLTARSAEKGEAAVAELREDVPARTIELLRLELQRRVDAAGWPLVSTAAHPGWAATNLQAAGPRMAGSRVGEWFSSLGNRLFAQDARQGARPLVHAAAGEDVRGGDYWAPGGLGGMRGAPTRVPMPPQAYDGATARRLWEVSEELTGMCLDVAV